MDTRRKSARAAPDPIEAPDLATALASLARAVEAQDRDDVGAPGYLSLLEEAVATGPHWERFVLLLGYLAHRYERVPKRRIAAAMGISHTTLYRRWAEHGFDEDPIRGGA